LIRRYPPPRSCGPQQLLNADELRYNRNDRGSISEVEDWTSSNGSAITAITLDSAGQITLMDEEDEDLP